MGKKLVTSISLQSCCKRLQWGIHSLVGTLFNYSSSSRSSTLLSGCASTCPRFIQLNVPSMSWCWVGRIIVALQPKTTNRIFGRDVARHATSATTICGPGWWSSQRTQIAPCCADWCALTLSVTLAGTQITLSFYYLLTPYFAIQTNSSRASSMAATRRSISASVL